MKSSITAGTIFSAATAIGSYLSKQQLNEIKGDGPDEAGLLRAYKYEGSIARLIADTIIEPTIIVSRNLKDTDIIESLINANINMFSAFYIQAFNHLVSLHNIQPRLAIAVLSSGRIKYSTEDFNINNVNDVKALMNEPSFLPINTDTVSLEADKYSKQRDSVTRNKVTMKERKDDALPLIISKSIEVTIDIDKTVKARNDDNGTKVNDSQITQIVIPITIKANIIYTNFDNIKNMVEPKGKDTSFNDRWHEYRSGAITGWDLAFAGDLVDKYKGNKMKDKDDLMKLMSDRDHHSKAKIVGSTDIGFDGFYSTVIIDSEQVNALNESLGKKIFSSNGADQFFEASKSMFLSVVDQDEERVNIFTKDIGGRSDIKFKSIMKAYGKDEANLNDLFKTMISNKTPMF